MPQQTIDAAKTAISSAQNEGAAHYAQVELTKAQSLLNDAMAQRQANNGTQAKSFAEQAKQYAQIALMIAQKKSLLLQRTNKQEKQSPLLRRAKSGGRNPKTNL